MPDATGLELIAQDLREAEPDSVLDTVFFRERATILSFDSLMSSSGGVWTQPVLGRAADAWGYPPTYVIGAGISLLGARPLRSCARTTS